MNKIKASYPKDLQKGLDDHSISPGNQVQLFMTVTNTNTNTNISYTTITSTLGL